jgi:hypothetical protein
MLTISRADTKEFPAFLERFSQVARKISGLAPPDSLPLKRVHATIVQLNE